LTIISLSDAFSQVGIGLTVSDDLYNVYSNEEDGLAHRRNGSVLLNPAIGPKIWVGSKNVSFSVEAQASLSVFGLAVKDYKGLGAASFPIMAKLNFKGLSGFSKDLQIGYIIGGGIQYSKTELYGLKQEFEDIGVSRDFYKTYNIQLGVGGGVNGFGVQFYGRYGFNPDLEGASNLHFGLQFDFNIPQLKKIKRPESEL